MIASAIKNSYNSKESLKHAGFTFNTITKSWDKEFSSKEEFDVWYNNKFTDVTYAGRKGARINSEVIFDLIGVEEVEAAVVVVEETVVVTPIENKDMKTKNEVIEFAQSELSCNNTLVIATLGNGGAGLGLIQAQDEEFVHDFIKELTGYYFEGPTEDCEDIKESEYYTEGCKVYQFSDNKGYKIQIMTF